MIKSRRRWAGHVARMEDRRGAHRVLMWRPDEGGSLGRPRRRWEDNIKTDLQKVRWGGVDWLALAQERDRRRELVNVLINLRVP